jgi:hypothetical protein
MQMVRQNDDGIDRKRALVPRRTKGAAQEIDVFHEGGGSAVR